MKRVIERTQRILHIIMMVVGLATMPMHIVHAAPCNGLPSIGDISISNCTLTVAGITGVDQSGIAESSTSNTGLLTLQSGAAVTINSGGTLVTGSLLMTGGTIAIENGGFIKTNTPAYIADADADGWASTTLSSATLRISTASGYRRLGLMRNTSADCSESTFSAANSCGVVATGGTITTSGGNTIHTFTSGGTFTILAGTSTVDYLIVGGGGAGGSGYNGSGGGGGGGGVKTGVYTVSPGTYTVTVGSGGDSVAGNSTARGNSGSTSSVFAISASGGGGGGTTVNQSGADGGTGGGGATGINATYGTGGSGINGQGFAGGHGDSNSGGASPYRYVGGGGGGAGAQGQDALMGTGGYAGNGGIGVASSISGASVYYGGGGGGGSGQESGTCSTGAKTRSSGGTGGGGAGGRCTTAAVTGTPNTGGGGGGGGYDGVNGGALSSGSGGSGIVIISYPTMVCETNYYTDGDQDGFGSGSVASCVPGAGYAANNTDCYDANANAYPSSSYCSATHRGDGSYDYNCSTTSTTCNATYYYNSTYQFYRYRAATESCIAVEGDYRQCAVTPVSCGEAGYLPNGYGSYWYECPPSQWCNGPGTPGSQACQ